MVLNHPGVPEVFLPSFLPHLLPLDDGLGVGGLGTEDPVSRKRGLHGQEGCINRSETLGPSTYGVTRTTTRTYRSESGRPSSTWETWPGNSMVTSPPRYQSSYSSRVTGSPGTPTHTELPTSMNLSHGRSITFEKERKDLPRGVSGGLSRLLSFPTLRPFPHILKVRSPFHPLFVEVPKSFCKNPDLTLNRSRNSQSILLSTFGL